MFLLEMTPVRPTSRNSPFVEHTMAVNPFAVISISYTFLSYRIALEDPLVGTDLGALLVLSRM